MMLTYQEWFSEQGFSKLEPMSANSDGDYVLILHVTTVVMIWFYGCVSNATTTATGRPFYFIP